MEFSMEQLVEQAKSIEAKLTKMDDLQKLMTEEKAMRATLAQEVKALGEQQLHLARQMLEIEQQRAKKLGGDENRFVSLGERFVQSEAFQNFREGRLTKATLAAASPVKTPDGAVQPDYRGIVGEPELPNFVANAFVHFTTGSNSIQYCCGSR